MTDRLPSTILDAAVTAALFEDLGGRGDITSQATIGPDRDGVFAIAARESGVVSGIAAASETFARVDPDIVVDWQCGEGDGLQPGGVVARVRGPARSILTAERTALNFLGRLSGIATMTRSYVEAIAGSSAVIAHTRKTTPGLRALELQAVTAGGGVRHRFGLDDAILIKDNHVAICGSVAAAVDSARRFAGHMIRVAVEVDRLDQLDEAIDAGAESVLLDNFSLDDLASAVARVRGRGVVLEASGGVDLESVRSIADTGVDVISVGAITHSAPAFDFGLDAVALE